MLIRLDAADARGQPNVSSRTSGKWDLFADAFAWHASQQASSVWADIIKIGDNTSSFGAQNLSFDWDFGFRVGAGCNLEYDGWDTQLYWTWFRTTAHQTKDLSPKFIGGLVTEQIHPEFFAADLSDDFSAGASIRWTIRFNMFDWELGRCYWVSKALSLRPFVGIKGGWIDQTIHVKYNHLIIASAPTTLSSKETVKNNFWGVGPALGVNTKWKVRNFRTHYPSLFGDFSAATMWGTWNCHDVYNKSSGEKVTVSAKKLTLGALMFRGFAGVGWDVNFNKDRSHFAARIGYEMQLWVNQLRVATSQLVPLHGDLTLQGVTLNCRFDF